MNVVLACGVLSTYCSLGFFNALPDGMVLDRHDPWCQQLKLLLNLEPVAACGHLDAIMEHCAKRVALQCPATSPPWFSFGAAPCNSAMIKPA